MHVCVGVHGHLPVFTRILKMLSDKYGYMLQKPFLKKNYVIGALVL